MGTGPMPGGLRTVRCPRCGALLGILPPPPGQPVIQVITELRCPVCGAVIGTAPTGGYRVYVISRGGKFDQYEIVGQRTCPRCGALYLVVRNRLIMMPMIYPPRPAYTPCRVCGYPIEHDWGTFLLYTGDGTIPTPEPSPEPQPEPPPPPGSQTRVSVSLPPITVPVLAFGAGALAVWLLTARK